MQSLRIQRPWCVHTAPREDPRALLCPHGPKGGSKGLDVYTSPREDPTALVCTNCRKGGSKGGTTIPPAVGDTHPADTLQLSREWPRVGESAKPGFLMPIGETGGFHRLRVLLSVRPTLPRGGGWVGLAEFQGGWVSNHPPPPGWGGTLWGPLGLSSQCHFFLSSVAGSV